MIYSDYFEVVRVCLVVCSYKWVCLRNFVIQLAYAPLQTIYKKSNERTNKRETQMLDKERCIKEQIYFELLYVSCIQVTS